MTTMARALRFALAALALTVAGSVLALVGPAGPAGAHASLQGTDPLADALVPAVPGTITLRFDEPVTTSTGAIEVISPNGDRVDQGVSLLDGGRTVAVTLSGATDGTYTVAYRVVSDDGHTIAGSYVFHVRTRTGAADIDQSIPVTTSLAGGLGRWLSYSGSIVAVGGAAMLLLSRGRGGAGAAEGSLARLVIVGAVVGGMGADLAVLAQTATTTGRSLVDAIGLVPDLAADSRSLAVALARASVLLGAALLAILGRQRPDLLIAAGGLVVAANILAPLAGHPWTAEAQVMAVTSDAFHLLAASVWIGLVTALATTARRLPDPLGVIRRVSTLSLIGAAVVLLTGISSAWQLLGSADALLHTASGQLVILKLIGFAGLVILGWINRSRLIPLLVGNTPAGMPDGERSAEGGDGRSADLARGSDGGAEVPTEEVAAPAIRSDVLTRLVQVLRTEVVVAAVVLAVTAGLVNQPPGRDVIDEPVVQVLTVDGVTMRLDVDPAKAGVNDMHLYASDAEGRAAPFDAAEATAALGELPPRRLELQQITPDHAVIVAASLPNPGTWTIVITTVRVSTPREYRFEVPIR